LFWDKFDPKDTQTHYYWQVKSAKFCSKSEQLIH